MRVIATGVLQEYWRLPGRSDSEEPLRAWLAEARTAAWKTPAEVRAMFATATLSRTGLATFNIAGSKYRLVARIEYERQICRVKFVGTCAEYERAHIENIVGGAQ